jgi:hypothetical protein
MWMSVLWKFPAPSSHASVVGRRSWNAPQVAARLGIFIPATHAVSPFRFGLGSVFVPGNDRSCGDAAASTTAAATATRGEVRSIERDPGIRRRSSSTGPADPGAHREGAGWEPEPQAACITHRRSRKEPPLRAEHFSSILRSSGSARRACKHLTAIRERNPRRVGRVRPAALSQSLRRARFTFVQATMTPTTF